MKCMWRSNSYWWRATSLQARFILTAFFILYTVRFGWYNSSFSPRPCLYSHQPGRRSFIHTITVYVNRYYCFLHSFQFQLMQSEQINAMFVLEIWTCLFHTIHCPRTRKIASCLRSKPSCPSFSFTTTITTVSKLDRFHPVVPVQNRQKDSTPNYPTSIWRTKIYDSVYVYGNHCVHVYGCICLGDEETHILEQSLVLLFLTIHMFRVFSLSQNTLAMAWRLTFPPYLWEGFFAISFVVPLFIA